jgi:hypothetical protein
MVGPQDRVQGPHTPQYRGGRADRGFPGCLSGCCQRVFGYSGLFNLRVMLCSVIIYFKELIYASWGGGKPQVTHGYTYEARDQQPRETHGKQGF